MHYNHTPCYWNIKLCHWRSEVLAAVLPWIQVFWDVTLCCGVSDSRCFKRTYCFCLKGSSSGSWSDWPPRMTATLRNVGNCLPKDSVASKKTWTFSITSATHYSAHVVLIESVLVVIIRRRIKVLFITRTVVCLLNDVWRSINFVHFCEVQICVTPLLSRARCQRQSYVWKWSCSD
jgi:hypothetical protein